MIRSAGMNVFVDGFGNIIGRSRGVQDGVRAVACGSHIDTVPNGGRLDGAYGVLAGIEAVRTLHEHNANGGKALQVIVFTEEEGARFGSFIGSRGFTRQLTKKTAYSLKDKDGISFRNIFKASSSLHLAPNAPSRLSRNLDSYVELHIEQGPILEYEHKSIGVVDSIVGLADLVIEIHGKAGHAGTTPLRLRQDALVGAARIVTGVRRIAKASGGNAVATVGTLTVEPGASNVIPGKVTVNVDYRNSSARGMRVLNEKIIQYAKRVGREENLQIAHHLESYTKPVRMSQRIMKIIEASADSLKLPSKRMQSGAGHDCQNMAQLTETGMIFVPSRDGISHTPKEFTEPKQLEAGANVLLLTLQRLCNN